MIAETLAGIALVKSAVDGIKSAIGTANDIGEIAGHIDDLFLGEQQAQRAALLMNVLDAYKKPKKSQRKSE
mgnify:CR=1 FL=1